MGEPSVDPPDPAGAAAWAGAAALGWPAPTTRCWWSTTAWCSAWNSSMQQLVPQGKGGAPLPGVVH